MAPAVRPLQRRRRELRPETAVGVLCDLGLILGLMIHAALAYQHYASDPKFKKYTQQVEKCLSSFDNVSEWADFIAFLKQLLKVKQFTTP